ncbi:MAG: hypothetical protein IPL65_03650 [Lewinellaceae bacterium]|nr:hypothetical protein [Lewinellaceae bacterium]
MFTINIYLRLALIGGGIVLGAALWMLWGFWYGFPFLLVGILLLIGYLLLGTIMSTNNFLSQQRFPEAEERLKLTWFPQLLLVGYKGVYYMTHGALALQKKDFSTAESWLKKALDAGLPSDNERAAALLQLALISASKNNRQAALSHVADIKKLSVTEPMIKEQVKDLEKQLKQMQQSMNPSTMAMMGGRGGFRAGSKRPRPKMK